MPTAAAAIVVGAGPAGLASAACLARKGIAPVVLEAGPSLGTSWRNAYDRLHLHTVKEHSALPGLPFASDVPRYPSRDDVILYLEAYAKHFGLAPRVSSGVQEIADDGYTLVVRTVREAYRSNIVVVATGLNRVPNSDALAGQSCFQGAIVPTGRYRNGAAYAGHRALVVG